MNIIEINLKDIPKCLGNVDVLAWLYKTGTTDTLNTYLDEELTVLAMNPMRPDAFGVFDVVYSMDQYYVKITDDKFHGIDIDNPEAYFKEMKRLSGVVGKFFSTIK